MTCHDNHHTTLVRSAPRHPFTTEMPSLESDHGWNARENKQARQHPRTCQRHDHRKRWRDFDKRRSLQAASVQWIFPARGVRRRRSTASGGRPDDFFGPARHFASTRSAFIITQSAKSLPPPYLPVSEPRYTSRRTRVEPRDPTLKGHPSPNRSPRRCSILAKANLRTLQRPSQTFLRKLSRPTPWPPCSAQAPSRLDARATRRRSPRNPLARVCRAALESGRK